MRTRLLVSTAALVGLVACNDNVDPQACANGDVIVTANLPGGNTGVDADVSLSGTAIHDDGASIQKLWVVISNPSDQRSARVPATKDTTNFETWSAQLPINLLRDYASNNEVSVRAEIRETCELADDVELGTIHLDPLAGIEVTEFELAVEYPTPIEAIPASGELDALLVVSAASSAVGVPVELSGEDLQFADFGNTTLVLQNTGTNARAVTQISSQVPGSKLAIAKAKDALAQTVVHVVGPPAITPASWTLGAGASVPLSAGSVGGDGEVDAGIRCQASPSMTLTAMSGQVDLSAMPGGSDTNGDGRVDITVSADAMAMAGDSLTISCVDGFGQAATPVTVTVE